jgi:hypothetical protein
MNVRRLTSFIMAKLSSENESEEEVALMAGDELVDEWFAAK